MIRIENLHKNFGGVRAVDNASLQISEGAITGLIGPMAPVNQRYSTVLLVYTSQLLGEFS